MPSAGDLINGALRLIGQLAEGETPSIDTSQDMLVAMQQMLESWSIERLSVFSTMQQVFTWPANFKTQTIGPTGDFAGLRPVAVDDSTYFIGPDNLSFGVMIVNEEQYNAIALKSVTSTYPNVLWVNNDFPNMSLTVYPVPTQDLEWHIVSVTELTQPVDLTTDLSFPPGYLRAFRYSLACEFAPEFGVEPSPQVKRIAMVSKRNLRRINDPGDIMALPYSLIQSGSGRFNCYTGGFN